MVNRSSRRGRAQIVHCVSEPSWQNLLGSRQSSMALRVGDRLGPYEIVNAIGAGGMGEVYRARDTKLDRDVAIKVLPVDALSDPHARTRLAREARLVASLNHPAICTVHDVGEAGGRSCVTRSRSPTRSPTRTSVASSTAISRARTC